MLNVAPSDLVRITHVNLHRNEVIPLDDLYVVLSITESVRMLSGMDVPGAVVKLLNARNQQKMDLVVYKCETPFGSFVPLLEKVA